MRWTIFFVVCLAVASAKYGKKTRFGQILQDVANLETEIEKGLDDTWSDDDSEEDSSDEELIDQRRTHYQPQQKKQKSCPHCADTRKKQRDEEDFESQEDDDYAPVKRGKKHQRHGEDSETEICQPKFDLIRKLTEVNVNLAAKLHRGAKQMDDDQNTVVSPVAVQLALASVAQGSRGNTRHQLDQILDFGLPKHQYQNAYAALIRSMKREESGQETSNSVQIKCTTSLILGQQSAQERFIETIKQCFDGEVKKCQFRQKPEECRDQITQWVANKAGLKSSSKLPQTAVSGNTKMISIGTMQLKTSWGKQFRRSLKTVQGQFYPLGEQSPVTVKTLQAEGDFNYFEDEQLKVIGIPTQEKQLTMYVLLPKDRHGLGQVEKRAIQYGKQLQQLLDRCDAKKQKLNVHLPAFQVAYKMDVKQVLRTLGIEDVFDGDEADFSGINQETEDEELLKYGKRKTGGLEDIDIKKASEQHKHQQLYLNKLIQVATIQIDENGLDAAGGQASSKATKSEDEDREKQEPGSGKQFKADHAFAFAIKHNQSNQLLLIGRVVDAVQKANLDYQMGGERERA